MAPGYSCRSRRLAAAISAVVGRKHVLTAIAFRAAWPSFVTIINNPSAIAAGTLDQHRIQDHIRRRSMRPDRLEAGLFAVGTHYFDDAPMTVVELVRLTAIAAHGAPSVTSYFLTGLSWIQRSNGIAVPGG